MQAMESVEAVDESTVTIRMRYLDADFLLFLANGISKVVAREAVELNGDLKEGPTIGSGPWMLNEFSLDATSFEANPGYYEPGVPGLQLLDVPVIPAASTMTAAVQVERVDLGLNAAEVNLSVGFTLKVADYGDMHLALANQYKRMLD